MEAVDLNNLEAFLVPGSSRVTADPSQPSGYSRVLQGQEFSTLRVNFAESIESDAAEKSVIWPPSVDDEKVDVVSASRRHASESWMASGRQEPTYTDLLSGFGANVDSSHGLGASFLDQTAAGANRKLLLDQEGKYNLLASPWSLMSSGLSLKLSESNGKIPLQGREISYQSRGNSRYCPSAEYTMRVEQSQGNWLMPPPPSQFGNHAHAIELPKPKSVHEHETTKPMDGNCKLFGIPLFSSPVPTEAVSHKNMDCDPTSHAHPQTHKPNQLESDQRSEQSKGSKMPDENEHEKQIQAGQMHTRDAQGKPQNGSTRSCTKVLCSFVCKCFFLY